VHIWNLDISEIQFNLMIDSTWSHDTYIAWNVLYPCGKLIIMSYCIYYT